MRIICEIFYIMLFVTVVGGVFTILSLAANRVMRFTLPLWFGVCGMAAYILPFLSPGLRLVPPEEQSWIEGYYVACKLWFCGMILFTALDLVRAKLAHRARSNYRVCENERVKSICAQCAGIVHLKKPPLVCFGTLDDPACVVGVLHPVIILNERIILQLTDTELSAILCHEMVHIRRGHIILGRVFDYICILNWLNPLAWIAKREFAVHCEIDCDRSALTSLEGRLTGADYARAMVRLLGLSVEQAGNACGMSALGFLLAKRRIERILHKPTRAKKIVVTSVLVLLLAMTILFSMYLSRGHFYPYPAYRGLTEYSSACG